MDINTLASVVLSAVNFCLIGLAFGVGFHAARKIFDHLFK